MAGRAVGGGGGGFLLTSELKLSQGAGPPGVWEQCGRGLRTSVGHSLGSTRNSQDPAPSLLDSPWQGKAAGRTRGQGQPSALLCRRDREGGGLYLGWDKGLLRQHLSAETKERAVRCRSNSAPLPLPQAAPAGRGGGPG